MSVMNIRNVEALALIICNESSWGLSSQPCERCMSTAADLAEKGVLVPSTLTDDEVFSLLEYPNHICQDTDGEPSTTIYGIKATLERIARGEV